MISCIIQRNATDAPSADQTERRRHARRWKTPTGARTSATKTSCATNGGQPISHQHQMRRWSTGRRRLTGGDTFDISDVPVALDDATSALKKGAWPCCAEHRRLPRPGVGLPTSGADDLGEDLHRRLCDRRLGWPKPRRQDTRSGAVRGRQERRRAWLLDQNCRLRLHQTTMR